MPLLGATLTSVMSFSSLMTILPGQNNRNWLDTLVTYSCPLPAGQLLRKSFSHKAKPNGNGSLQGKAVKYQLANVWIMILKKDKKCHLGISGNPSHHICITVLQTGKKSKRGAGERKLSSQSVGINLRRSTALMSCSGRGCCTFHLVCKLQLDVVKLVSVHYHRPRAGWFTAHIKLLLPLVGPPAFVARCLSGLTRTV